MVELQLVIPISSRLLYTLPDLYSMFLDKIPDLFTTN